MIPASLYNADVDFLGSLFQSFGSQIQSFWDLLNSFEIPFFIGQIQFGRLLVSIVVVAFAMSVIVKR